MKNTVKICLVFVAGLSFGSCVTPNVPDYNSLQKSIKPVDVKKGYVGDGDYQIIGSSTTNFKLELAGYNENFSNTSKGSSVITRMGKEVRYIDNIELSFLTSNVLRLEYYSDRCGTSSNKPYLEILDKNGMVHASSHIARNNDKVQEMLQNLSKRKNIFACSDWKVGQIKNSVDFFNSLISFTHVGDKLTFIPLTLPVKYHGVVFYSGREFYYFTVSDGLLQVDSENFSDDIAKFKANAKILVNPKNFITEYLSIQLVGNMWMEGHNFDVNFKHNIEMKPF